MRRKQRVSGYVIDLTGKTVKLNTKQLALLFEEDTTPTVAEFGPMWLKDAEEKRQKPAYQKYKAWMFEKYLKPHIGHLRLSQVDGAAIAVMRRATKELSNKSVNNVLSLVSNMLRTAVRLGYNVTKIELECLTVTTRKIDFYSFDELTKLVHSAGLQGAETLALVLLAAHAGLRRGEILGLQWRDVDFISGNISVQRSLVAGVVSSPKNGQSRTVPMTSSLKKALLGLPNKGEFLFLSQTGKPVGPKWVYAKLAALSEASGVKAKGQLHVLRHTFCSHLAMRGVSVLAIKELAGHSRTDVTQRYMHLQDDVKRKAVEVLENPSPA